MEIVFWGTRGSLPRPLRASDVREKVVRALSNMGKISPGSAEDIESVVSRLSFDIAGTFGGNTACVEIRGGEEVLILDAGTGIRDLGGHLASGHTEPLTLHLLLSHFHWDHVQGFPFFGPAYGEGNVIHIYGFHDEIEESLRRQQEAPFFPVPLDAMPASIHFHRLDPEQPSDIAGFRVTGFRQNHPGDSYGYALERDGRKVVYSTDAEHYEDWDTGDYPFVEFIRDADLLIFDAAYTLADGMTSRRDWGHSSNMIGVELSVRAGVRRLCLVHHEHTADDRQLHDMLEKTRRYAVLHGADQPLEVIVGWDELVIEI